MTFTFTGCSYETAGDIYLTRSPYVEAAIWKFYTHSVESGGIEVELWSCVERMKHRNHSKYDHISHIYFLNLQHFFI